MYNGPERKSLRLEGFDYSASGYYFVTICCYKKQCFFGEIVNDEMVLNQYGKIAEGCWDKITTHYPKVVLDSVIVMPNHIHGIIIIRDECTVGNENFHSLHDVNHGTDLSNIIKGFKIGCTKEIRSTYDDYEFKWQKSFYDVIIRND